MPRPACQACFDQFPAGHLDDPLDDLRLRSQPELRQFEHGLAGFGDRRAAHRIQTGLRSVLAQMATIGRRQRVSEPAQHGAEVVQQGQRQSGQEAEQETHAERAV